MFDLIHHMTRTNSMALTSLVTSVRTMSILLGISLILQVVWVEAGQSPVLIWSPASSLKDLPQAFVGSTINKDKFLQEYLLPLTGDGERNIIVFQQDKLRLEDFTNYADVYNAYSNGGAFKNIKNLMEDHFSVHIPNVKDPEHAVATIIKKFEGAVHNLKQPFDLDSLKLSGNKRNLILVNLPTYSGEMCKEDMLSKNDKLVGKILEGMEKKGVEYTAVYTGKHGGKRSSFSPEVAATRRKLLETDDIANATFLNVSDKMFFYVQTVNFTIIKEKQFFTTILPAITDIGDSKVENDTAVVNLKYNLNSHDDSLDMVIDLKLEISMKKRPNQKDWIIGNVTLAFNGTWNGTEFEEGEDYMEITALYGDELGAPSTFSYHCPRVGPIKFKNETDKEAKPRIYFTHFQLQPFNLKNGKFSNAYDCIPFFTPGIWMALFCSAILLLLVAWGMAMISSLTTMDRFDDPKGKTITVTVNE